MKANIQWYPPHRLAAVTGAGVFCGAAGGLAATLPVQAMLPWLGWRGVFLGLAGLAVLAALWLRLGVPAVAPGARTRVRRPLGAEIAEFARIARHPVFIRTMPAVALLSAQVFTYQGLWAGPWLRDVGGPTTARGPACCSATRSASWPGSFAAGSSPRRCRRAGWMPCGSAMAGWRR